MFSNIINRTLKVRFWRVRKKSSIGERKVSVWFEREARERESEGISAR